MESCGLLYVVVTVGLDAVKVRYGLAALTEIENGPVGRIRSSGPQSGKAFHPGKALSG